MTETLLMVVYNEPVPPSQLQPKVPRDLETICLKCLSKEPARRYATAGAGRGSRSVPLRQTDSGSTGARLGACPRSGSEAAGDGLAHRFEPVAAFVLSVAWVRYETGIRDGVP